MFYEKELRFLCDTLKKAHIHTAVVSPGEAVSSIVPPELESLFSTVYPDSMPLHKVLGSVEQRTMYRVVDMLHLSYIYFILPDSPRSEYFFFGPYTRSHLSPQQIMELGEHNGVSPKNLHCLEEYYSSIPIIPENSPFFTMLHTFCELIWASPSFAVVDADREWLLPVSPINDSMAADGFDEVLVSMMALEKRYAYENEMIQAVELGQIHKETLLLSFFSEQVFERRTSDPVRNLKNYCIIMNTLLRKAAERGGVHPMYIDRVSSSFAFKIEQVTAVATVAELMTDMFRSYCRLVRKHSLKDYSPVVQKAVILIDSDLSANLTLSTIADNQSISPGYLSTVFKKETGKTVSEYIRDKRMKHAAHLLSTTHLQIQTIALHCGIMDVQYFSKIFKKQTGKTPKEYREASKQN